METIIIFTPAGEAAFRALARYERQSHPQTVTLHPSEYADDTPPDGESGAPVGVRS